MASFRSRRLVRLGVALALLLLAGMSFLLWFYHFRWPRYRTRYSPRFEKQAFFRIAVGDTQDVVLSTLGPPLYRESGPANQAFLFCDPPLCPNHSVTKVRGETLESWYFSLPKEGKEGNWSYHKWVLILSPGGKVVGKICRNVAD